MCCHSEPLAYIVQYGDERESVQVHVQFAVHVRPPSYLSSSRSQLLFRQQMRSFPSMLHIPDKCLLRTRESDATEKIRKSVGLIVRFFLQNYNLTQNRSEVLLWDRNFRDNQSSASRFRGSIKFYEVPARQLADFFTILVREREGVH